ncbi:MULTISPECIES: arylamine N-acetyltransferase family protein [Streptomyces]|uniref:arylamine N-acetyltransferase family protein n=1 Tax=Streptomyces TaxID=1883 RepID=UPI000BFF29F3|nr:MULTISPECIES: arylamine N-acetyltransferase [Streptomyces]ATL81594.1 arylamine N-acetyltransferase [Streptomyces malaysiensis]MCC4316549.1 arylamine N-acetyltransferase [Streptomyces malaysiensis]MCD9592643.1 arylamine N-acetyltransferase [Streptomyces sp. 8ZJF_21]UHH16710.1 arylamine N-acetyltransferase [Streptomyces sp. HNM0561]
MRSWTRANVNVVSFSDEVEFGVFVKKDYLQRIGYEGSGIPNLQTLAELQWLHLCSLPYDTGYILHQPYEDFDMPRVFEAVMKRGGVCFELNFLFHRLLVEMGFDAHVNSASTALPGGQWGSEIEHMAVRVRIDDVDWLVDVGHGSVAITEPLRIDEQAGSVVQMGTEFRLATRGEWRVLQYKPKGRDWRDAYRMKIKDRAISDWNTWREELPPDADPVVPRKRRRGVENGQVTLVANLFRSIIGGEETVKHVRDEAELIEIMTTYWGESAPIVGYER